MISIKQQIFLICVTTASTHHATKLMSGRDKCGALNLSIKRKQCSAEAHFTIEETVYTNLIGGLVSPRVVPDVLEKKNTVYLRF